MEETLTEDQNTTEKKKVPRKTRPKGPKTVGVEETDPSGKGNE
jgi:hypothetical protein